jgi:3-oxoacyl-[acyl-carrier protein] reductase
MAGTAVVTGGASGIGRRTVERLLDDGWTVWIFDLPRTAADEQIIPAVALGRCRFQACDVRDAQSVAAAFSAVTRESDGLDALVCSAGVMIPGALEAIETEQVDQMIAVNLRGPWLSVRAALPLLKKNGHPGNPSRIVLVGSVAGLRPKTGNGFYSATKAALHVLAGVLGSELAPAGILVNAVAPGSVATPMLRAAAGADDKSGYRPSGAAPIGRIGQPDDIADVILFLLSQAANFVTGTVLPVDGGTRAAFVAREI